MTVLDYGEQEVVYWSSYVDDNGLDHHFIKPPLLLVQRECAKNSLTKFFSLLNPIKFCQDDLGQRNKFQSLKLAGFNKFLVPLRPWPWLRKNTAPSVCRMPFCVSKLKLQSPVKSACRRCLKKKDRGRLLLLIGGRGRGDGVGKTLECPRGVTTPKCTLR